MNTQIHDMVLRSQRPADEIALRRLAALDSTLPLRGHSLVAEVGGRPVAALDLTDGRVVADPFVRTAGAVALLRLHAGRTTTATATTTSPRRRLRGLLPRRLAA